MRLISPGTLVEDTLLSPRRSNYLCALSSSSESDHYGFSVVDISTGELAVHNVGESQLASLLARYDPREILVSPSLQSRLPPSLQQYLRATGSGVGVDPRLSDVMDSQCGEVMGSQCNDTMDSQCNDTMDSQCNDTMDSQCIDTTNSQRDDTTNAQRIDATNSGIPFIPL